MRKKVRASKIKSVFIWDCLVRTEQELGFIPVPLPEARIRIDAADKQSYYYDDVKELHTKVPIILVGGNRNIENMEALLQKGKVEFLSLSRPLILEPGLPNRWLSGVGKETAGCVSCNACLVFKEEYGCALARMKMNREMFEARLKAAWRDAFK